MKAIKDCEWEVAIFNNSYGKWFWVAYPKDEDSVGEIHGGMGETRKSEIKRRWEKFAKLNGIKKWRYT